MKAGKQIKAIPWPEHYAGIASCDFSVSGTYKVVDHERSLIPIFMLRTCIHKAKLPSWRRIFHRFSLKKLAKRQPSCAFLPKPAKNSLANPAFSFMNTGSQFLKNALSLALL